MKILVFAEADREVLKEALNASPASRQGQIILYRECELKGVRTTLWTGLVDLYQCILGCWMNFGIGLARCIGEMIAVSYIRAGL
jgi:hypothetical protein